MDNVENDYNRDYMDNVDNIFYNGCAAGVRYFTRICRPTSYRTVSAGSLRKISRLGDSEGNDSNTDPPSLALAHLATGMIGPELLDLNYWTMNYWP